MRRKSARKGEKPSINHREELHTMKEIIQGFYQKKHFWTRLILVIAAVILMGFALSWLLLVDLGTDPCTLLNQTISTRLGISIGN